MDQFYHQMSHLPYSLSPIGRGSLGYSEKIYFQKMFPRLKERRIPVPISCPPNGIRIYETGNSYNPNTTSSLGYITPDDLGGCY